MTADDTLLRDPDDLLLAVMAGATAVGLWPLLLMLRAGPLHLAPLVAHTTGMLAGYGVLVLICLMSRAPGLERAVGSDQLARWHARGGRLVLSLVLVHATAAVLAWAQARRQGILRAALDVLGMPWLLATTIGTALLVAVAAVSVRQARRRLSYERWHAVHLLTYVGVALAFLHQLGGPDLAGHRVVQVLWSLLYVHTFGLVLRHRVLRPLRQASRHRLRVTAVQETGPGVVSIVMHGEHLDELGARPGQFFRWRFLTPDHWSTAHPFSLSEAPNGESLTITVKSLGDGSNRLQDLHVGTWVIAEGPYGTMTADRRTRPDVVLIAGGVGITPMRALFESMPVEPEGSLTLLYRARGPEHVLFRKHLDTVARRRGARVVYLLGEDPDLLSPASLRANLPRIARSDVYLCGPPGMADATRSALLRTGLPLTRLHEERFGW